MNMVQFDTLEYAKKLKSSGVSEEQAEAMTEAMRQVLESKDIATKQDLKELEVKIESTKSETIKWVVSLLVAQTGILAGVIIAIAKTFS